MNPGIKGPTFYGAMDTCLSVTCSHQSEPPPPPPIPYPPKRRGLGGQGCTPPHWLSPESPYSGVLSGASIAPKACE